jgi:hypothetical protein
LPAITGEALEAYLRHERPNPRLSTFGPFPDLVGR